MEHYFTLFSFLVGLLIGALVSFLVVRNNPNFLSFNAKQKIDDAIGMATGKVQWSIFKRRQPY